jgi:glutamate synthase domain-containing protein 2
MEVKDSPLNRKKCVCPGCPSYPHECRGELLYCSPEIGKSKCDIKAAGCNCNACPVYFENALKGLYFCDKEEIRPGVLMRKKSSSENPDFYQSIADIKDMAQTGHSRVRSMGSLKQLPYSLDDLHFVPAQVHRIPLNKEDKANTAVTIGPSARKPLRVFSPILISGMSYGATSKNVKLVISQACAKMKTAYNSGEGGILPEELGVASSWLIGQYATGRFGVNEEIIRKVAAVEIRFGQGAYPGKGSYLPAEKMTPEVSRLRGLQEGEPAYSPAHHKDMLTPEQIAQKVSYLRRLTGVPVGAKIGCGNVEKDVQVLVDAGVDFIALDGFGGGTGATDAYVRDNVGIPIFAALPRAHKFLEKLGMRKKITLIAGGKLRTSADFAKCLALGADAVYTGTAALIAINCEQYRICHTGLCPTGVTTHNPVLVKQLDVQKGAERLANWLRVCTEEIATLAHICGKDDVRKLGLEDLVALKKEMAELTGTKWIDGEHYGKD